MSSDFFMAKRLENMFPEFVRATLKREVKRDLYKILKFFRLKK